MAFASGMQLGSELCKALKLEGAMRIVIVADVNEAAVVYVQRVVQVDEIAGIRDALVSQKDGYQIVEVGPDQTIDVADGCVAVRDR